MIQNNRFAIFPPGSYYLEMRLESESSPNIKINMCDKMVAVNISKCHEVIQNDLS